MDITLTIGTLKTATLTITPDEEFSATVKLAGLASDVSLTLGAITDAKYIAVFGAEGVSFKIDSGGTDPVYANPFAILTEEDLGSGVDVILLSNSAVAEATVYVYAGE